MVQTADNALLFLQYEYETHGVVTQGIGNFIERAKNDPILNQIAMADAYGDLFLSAVPHGEPINIATARTLPGARRERRRRAVHRQARPDEGLRDVVVLPQPAAEPPRRLLGRHRLRRPRPRYFSGYYDNPEIGADRGVLLVGRDGIVRARRFNSSPRSARTSATARCSRGSAARRPGTPRSPA